MKSRSARRSKSRQSASYSRMLRIESLEERQVLSANFQGAGVGQEVIDLINNNEYSSTILQQDSLLNALNEISTSATAPGGATVVTDATNLDTFTFVSGNTYLLQGDFVTNDPIELPSNVDVYVDGSITKNGEHNTNDNGGSGNFDNSSNGYLADAIFRITDQGNINLIGIDNALLTNSATVGDLTNTIDRSAAVWITGGNSDNVTVEGFEISNVWEGLVARGGDIDNVTFENNYIHDVVRRAIWTLSTDDARIAHNFIYNVGYDGIDMDAYSENGIAYENVVVSAGRFFGFVEEGAHENLFVRNLGILADVGNPNVLFPLGWADNGTGEMFYNNNGQAIITENNYFIENTAFQGSEYGAPLQGNANFLAKQRVFPSTPGIPKGQSYFWGNEAFGSVFSLEAPSDQQSSTPSTNVPAASTGGTINSLTLLADLDTQYNTFTGGTGSSLDGDFDTDGNVDADDLGVWQSGYGTSLFGFDFLNWQRDFGSTGGTTGGDTDENVVTVLDTDYTAAQGYANGNLQFQEPHGSSAGNWRGQDGTVVDSSGTGTISSGPGTGGLGFLRNLWSIGATGGVQGVPSTAGFNPDSQLEITFDYQFTLGSDANTGLALVGFRDEGPNTGNSNDASPQDGFKIEYAQFADGAVKFFPDLNDTDNADALLIDVDELGLDPKGVNGPADFVSDNLRVSYVASVDALGVWSVDSFSVDNLDDAAAATVYAGPAQTLTYAGTDAFYGQRLANGSQAGLIGSSDGVEFLYTPGAEVELIANSIIDDDFTTAEGFNAGNLQFQNGWVGQTQTQVDPTGDGHVNSGGAFIRNLYNVGVHGSTAGSANDGMGNSEFVEGDQINIEMEYQFTLDAVANRDLFLTGVRENFSTGSFDASPTVGMKAHYNSFGDGAIKLFSSLARNGNLGTDNAFALITDAADIGIDQTTMDFISDKLQFTYTAELTDAGTDTWTVTELKIENLDTGFSSAASVDKPAALETFTYTANEMYFGSTWTASAATAAVDRVKFDYLTPPPVVLFGYETSYTAAEGYIDGALGQPNFQQGWLGQNQTVDSTGTGTLSANGLGGFLRNVYGNGVTGGAAGMPSGTGFNNGDQIEITYDYQFTLGSNANATLLNAGWRDEGPNAGNSFDASPQQGFKAEYNVFQASTGGSVKFFPDLADSANVDALILDGSLLGLDPTDFNGNGVDFVSDDLRINYLVSTDGAGNWTTSSFSVENLTTGLTYDYSGAAQTFAYAGTDAFLAQQLAPNPQAGYVGTSEGVKIRYLDPLPLGANSVASVVASVSGGFTELAVAAANSGAQSAESAAAAQAPTSAEGSSTGGIVAVALAGNSDAVLDDSSIAEQADEAAALDEAFASFESGLGSIL